MVGHPHRRAHRRATRRGSGPADPHRRTHTLGARHWMPSWSAYSSGCGCPISAVRPPSFWPPRKRNVGTPAKCSKRFWPKRFPGGTARADNPPNPCGVSPPAKPLPPGTRRCRRYRHPPSPHCAPWNGSTAAKTWWSAGRQAPARRFCSKPSANKPSKPGCTWRWFSLEQLGALVRRHRADDTVTKAIGRILRADLIEVDDIGLLSVGADAAEGLYRLVDAAYEKRSIALSSNLHPAGFDELMPKTMATATVDRLLHHAHVCQTSGESVRLTQAMAGKGVNALT